MKNRHSFSPGKEEENSGPGVVKGFGSPGEKIWALKEEACFLGFLAGSA